MLLALLCFKIIGFYQLLSSECGYLVLHTYIQTRSIYMYVDIHIYACLLFVLYYLINFSPIPTHITHCASCICHSNQSFASLWLLLKNTFIALKALLKIILNCCFSSGR